jgi:hypothetical protein
LHQDAVDLHVPETIQHSLHQQFEQEKTVLVKEKEELSKEIENSRTAFERYRERARESLLKTASDQKANEQKIEKLKEQLKVSQTFLSDNKRIFIPSSQNDQKSHEQVQQQLNSIKQTHQHELNELVMNLQKEKLKASEIQQQLEFLTIQMKENIVKEVESQQEEEKKQLELEVKPYLRF